MEIKAQEVAKLRALTNAGMMDCKKALEESGGDFDKAVEYLRKKGAATSAKRADKEAKEGFIAAYAHGGRIASMVEINCETDFVAKNKDFQEFVRDIAMQVAASSPQYISREDVPKKVIEKEKEIKLEKLAGQKKPKGILDKIIEGKLEKFYEQACLMDQPYIKDTDIKVTDFVNEKVASIGEKIQIRRFERFEIGK